MDKNEVLLKAIHFAQLAEATARQNKALVVELQAQTGLSMMYSQLYLAISKSEESK